jgi:hypothetical protein
MRELKLMPDGNPWGLSPGDVYQVNLRGTLTDVRYERWNPKYGLPEGRTMDGVKKIQNAYMGGEKLPAWQEGDSIDKVRRSSGRHDTEELVARAAKMTRFDVNTRFGYIEQLTNMVIRAKSKSLIITGSGGLGKTYTVLDCLKKASLVDKADLDHECDQYCVETQYSEELGRDVDTGCTVGDYVVIKGFSTPKGLYRLLYENRGKIVVCDDLDSIWENQTALNLLKSALDSYDVRRVAWLSEMKGEDKLPRSFLFTGRVIFISNLSLLDLDQAVVSRCLCVDVSMTREEKVERIKTLAPNIRKDLSMEAKQEAIDLLANPEVLPNIGDLNIRTFLKVLEIRDDGAENWRDIAEYAVTTL